ncbi:MAG: TonB-dependent vitamin B12 receptor [Tahibacter sp.]
MNRQLLAAAIAAHFSILCFSARAETGDTPLDDVVVTATRNAITVDDALSSVSVLTRDDIERLQATSIADLLRGLPGVSLANNGGAGKQTALFLRGTESDHTLVLIDGIKIGSATAGGAALQDLPIEQIERIEVVRGPRSSLYGSEAIGGVIQIFTRRAARPLETNFSVGIGSHDTRNASAGVGLKNDVAWLNANVAYADTDGINSCRGRPSPGGAGCFTFEPDRDPYRNESVSLRGGVALGEHIEVDGNFLRANGHNFYDGSFVNESKNREEAASAGMRFQATDSLSLHLSGGSSTDLSDNYEAGAFVSKFDTRRNQASLQADLTVSAAHRLSAGIDQQNDKVTSDTPYDESARRDTGIFGEYLGRFGAHDLQLSARSDENQQFGQHSTGSIGWGYTFSPALRVNASYGSAFKAPTFNELYYPGFGNANLEPESSRSVELGLRGRAEGLRWSTQAYQTVVSDLIAYDADIFAPGNVDRAQIRGIEASVGTDWREWTFDTSVTAMQPKNDSGGFNDGKILPRRARESGRVDVDRRYGPWRIGVTAFAEGKRYDDLANTRRLGGYSTVDLRFEYALSADWNLQARVANAFDHNYETASFYNQDGRNYFLTLRYRPTH